MYCMAEQFQGGNFEVLLYPRNFNDKNSLADFFMKSFYTIPSAKIYHR